MVDCYVNDVRYDGCLIVMVICMCGRVFECYVNDAREIGCSIVMLKMRARMGGSIVMLIMRVRTGVRWLCS